MTETVRVTVTLQEPVSVTRQLRSDFRQDTHDHIPGSVLRGALAARWIQHHGSPSTTDSEFAEVFEGEGSFSPLYAHGGFPVPLSVARHKYAPDDMCKQLWWDRALGETTVECPKRECGQRLEESKGQPQQEPEQHARTRVALDKDGVAEDGNLFTQNTLARTTELTGWLHGPAVRALHLDGEPITSLLLGAGRSVRGKATVQMHPKDTPEPVEQHGNVVVLRLAAPGVFVDEFGLPSAIPERKELAEVLGVEVAEIEDQDQWTRWTEVGGWHAASGLPKPTERAVERGSTYRIRCAEEPSEHARRALMTRGIGLRRREGFGALYNLPERPWGRAAWIGQFAPLVGWPTLPKIRHQLKNRTGHLGDGTLDDSHYRGALDPANTGKRVATALGKLLSITDRAFYRDVLDYLETGT